MLLQLYSLEVHSEAVLYSNFLVVCGKLEDYKVLVLLLISSWKFVEKKSKEYFLQCFFPLQAAAVRMWFLIASSQSCSFPEIYARKKNLTMPDVVLAIFKANAVFIGLPWNSNIHSNHHKDSVKWLVTVFLIGKLNLKKSAASPDITGRVTARPGLQVP